MTVAEPGETVEVLTIQLWHSQGEVAELVSLMLQVGPKYLIVLDLEAATADPSGGAQLAERAMWAWAHGGQIGLASYLASQPALWRDPHTSLRGL